MGPVGVEAADVNGDTHLDLIVANYGRIGLGNTVAVLINEGNGSFAAPVTYPVGPKPYKLGVRDLNGDARPDIVVARDGQKISVLMNTGEAFSAFVEYAVFQSVNVDVYANVELADADRDGDLDVFYGSTNTQSQRPIRDRAVLRTTGTARSASPTPLPDRLDHGQRQRDGRSRRHRAINGSTSSRSTSTTAVGSTSRAMDEGGFLPAVELPGGRDPIAVAVSDMDLPTRTSTRSMLTRDALMVSVFRNDGSGGFARHAGYPVEGLSHDMDAADIDGDGDLDVATPPTGTRATVGISVVRNLGDGSFGPQEKYPGTAGP